VQFQSASILWLLFRALIDEAWADRDCNFNSFISKNYSIFHIFVSALNAISELIFIQSLSCKVKKSLLLAIGDTISEEFIQKYTTQSNYA